VPLSLFSEAGETTYSGGELLALEVLLLGAVVELGVLNERLSSEELAVSEGPGSLDNLVSTDDAGTIDEDTSAGVSRADDEVGSDESFETTAVVVDVDKREDRSGRSTVTDAVANAVVLPNASTLAVTATTTSAFEFVLMTSENAAVP
jgi:hypothetical protein